MDNNTAWASQYVRDEIEDARDRKGLHWPDVCVRAGMRRNWSVPKRALRGECPMELGPWRLVFTAAGLDADQMIKHLSPVRVPIKATEDQLYVTEPVRAAVHAVLQGLRMTVGDVPRLMGWRDEWTGAKKALAGSRPLSLRRWQAMFAALDLDVDLMARQLATERQIPPRQPKTRARNTSASGHFPQQKAAFTPITQPVGDTGFALVSVLVPIGKVADALAALEAAR